MASKTVHIGNLSSQASEEAILSHFSSCGTITNIKLAGDPSFPARFAFIEFADNEQAQRACTLSGKEFFGKQLKIELAKNKITKPYSRSSNHSYSSHMTNTSPHQQILQQPPVAAQTLQPVHYTVPTVLPAATTVTPTTTTPRSYADPVARTIYVTGIDSSISEQNLIDFFSYCGSVTNHKLCGDTSQPTRFAFLEFGTPEAAMSALSLNGSVVGKTSLRISPSKTSIMASPTTKLPLSTTQKEQVERTVHIGSIDVSVSEAELKNFFQTQCGPINRVAMAGDTEQHATRFAFIEFQHKESAAAATKLNGTMLGSTQLKIQQSKSPILAGMGTKVSSSQPGQRSRHGSEQQNASSVQASYQAGYYNYNYAYPGYYYPYPQQSGAAPVAYTPYVQAAPVTVQPYIVAPQQAYIDPYASYGMMPHQTVPTQMPHAEERPKMKKPHFEHKRKRVEDKTEEVPDEHGPKRSKSVHAPKNKPQLQEEQEQQ